jgi:hypothetical protein
VLVLRGACDPTVDLVEETAVGCRQRSGMSVRATSQLIGAATAQQMMLELTARVSVVIIGSTKMGSTISVLKLASVNAPFRSTRL